MWFGVILVEILSGLMLSNAQTDQITAAPTFDQVLGAAETPTCGLGGPEAVGDSESKQVGCPGEIPVVREKDGKKEIVAARVYRGSPTDLQFTSCNGDCKDYLAETKLTSAAPNAFLFASLFVNPGCKVFVFEDYNFAGTTKEKEFLPGLHHKVKPELPLHPNSEGIAVAKSMGFTCTQVLPSCTPSDKWQTVATLENTDASGPTTFSYLKTVGTSFSTSITNSFSVSVTWEAEVKASLFGQTASQGVSATTGYDWTSLDEEEKTTTRTYNVDVLVPAGLKVHIEEVLGTCGGSSVHTQMFRVVDSHTGETLHIVRGNPSNFVVSTEKIYTMGSTVANGLGSGVGTGLGSCCPKKTIWGNMDPEKNGIYVNVGRKEADQIPRECNSPCVYVKQDSMKKIEYCFRDSWTSQFKCETMDNGSGSGSIDG